MTAFVHFDLTQLPQTACYKLLTGTVVPRPIAWVTTQSKEGRVNLAPFSFFNVLGSDPPLVAFAPGDRPDGTPKDTALNIGSGAEFTVNLVSLELAQVMNATATEFPYELGEPEALGIALEPGIMVRVPRVQASPAALECREVQTLRVGRNRVILGEVLGISLRADTLRDEGKHLVNTAALDLIGRMGGRGGYATTRDQMDLPRVSYAEWLEGQEEG